MLLDSTPLDNPSSILLIKGPSGNPFSCTAFVISKKFTNSPDFKPCSYPRARIRLTVSSGTPAFRAAATAVDTLSLSLAEVGEIRQDHNMRQKTNIGRLLLNMGSIIFFLVYNQYGIFLAKSIFPIHQRIGVRKDGLPVNQKGILVSSLPYMNRKCP
jgi:hypothetical protein